MEHTNRLRFLKTAYLVKQSNLESYRIPGKEILPVNSISGFLGDYVDPLNSGAYHVGKAKTLLQASGVRGEDVPWSMREPVQAGLLGLLGGGVTGSVLGGLSGGLLSDNRYAPYLGSAIGTLGGAGLGSIVMSARQRRRMKDAIKEYENAGVLDMLNAKPALRRTSTPLFHDMRDRGARDAYMRLNPESKI